MLNKQAAEYLHTESPFPQSRVLVKLVDEKVQCFSAFCREAGDVAAQESVEDTDEANRRGKIGLVLQAAHDEGHHPPAQDVSLLWVLREDPCMVCEDGFDELETKGLGQACEPKMFRSLVFR
jgi:hypothetical protein